MNQQRTLGSSGSAGTAGVAGQTTAPAVGMTERPLHERRYVRVREIRNGFVEFDFSIGDPMLSVELILPEVAFAEFCETNAVQTLDHDSAEALDTEKRTWRDGESDLFKKAGGNHADRHQDQ